MLWALPPWLRGWLCRKLGVIESELEALWEA